MDDVSQVPDFGYLLSTVEEMSRIHPDFEASGAPHKLAKTAGTKECQVSKTVSGLGLLIYWKIAVHCARDALLYC